jgi:hypothetical protein
MSFAPAQDENGACYSQLLRAASLRSPGRLGQPTLPRFATSERFQLFSE